MSTIHASAFVLLVIPLAPSVSGQQHPTVRVETLVVTQDSGDQSLFINQGGQVAGNRIVNGNLRAFCWTRQKGILDLGTLGGATSSAYGINDLGQIVGTAETAGGVPHAFIYAEGTMTDLNDLLPADSGWLVLTQAKSINNNGQVVGTGITTDGYTHAFVLDMSQ